MKILTLNFLTCARKACKANPAAFPLHAREAELEIAEADFNPVFIRNILPRLEWHALKSVCGELGLPDLPSEAPAPEAICSSPSNHPAPEQTPDDDDEVEEAGEGREAQRQPGATSTHSATQEQNHGEPTQLAQDLHRLLLETTIASGKLVCGNCGHEYAIKEGIANFLLPSHLV